MIGAALFAVGDATWESFPPGIIQVFYKEDDDKLKQRLQITALAIDGICDSPVLGVILANYFRAKIVILLVCLGLCTVSLLILHF